MDTKTPIERKTVLFLKPLTLFHDLISYMFCSIEISIRKLLMGAINDNSDGVPWHFLRQHAVESVLHAGQERERPGNSNSHLNYSDRGCGAKNITPTRAVAGNIKRNIFTTEK